jgi:tetratricopeptide (TPR) repeat protein
VLARTLYDQVSQIPGLPESVRAQAKRPATAQPATDRDEEDVSPEFQARARLMAALREASSPGATSAVQAKAGPGSESGKASSNAPGEKPSARLADIGEPSWAALGHLIQEVSFVHVWRRADFERHQLSVPSDDFLALAAPLVKDHPLRPFLDTLAWDVVKQRDAMARAARLAPDGLELQAEPLLSSFVQFHVSSGNPILKAMVQRNDAVTRDYVVMGRLMALQNNPTQLRGIAESLLSISPQSPLARGYLVSVGAASKDQIAHWEKPAVKYPFLAYALAGHYAKAKQWDDAAGWCQVAIKIAEDTDLYQFLADVYQKKGDERRWLETLEAALRLPDYALDHAQIQSKIAYHFMAKKQWKRALPYATGAAESYSGWGLLCAAACYEALQEWDKAEQYARATAERYRMSSYEWYRFCRRTGHGDLQAARRLARAYAEDHSAQDDRNARYYVASFFVLEAERDKAMALFREQFASEADPVLGLWIAVLADELKDAKTRDAALARIRTDGSSAVVGSAGRPRKELIQLADWIERDLAQGGKGQIDLQAVEELRAAAQQAGDLSFFDVFLARYLQSHGNRDEAIHYWKERLASTDVLNDSRTFAGAALCDLGLMPETYKALLEEAPQAEAKKQDKKESTENGKSGHPKPAGAAAKSRA